MEAAFFIIGLIVGMLVSLFIYILFFLSNREIPKKLTKIEIMEAECKKYRVVGDHR